jgi:hypothetical protein
MLELSSDLPVSVRERIAAHFGYDNDLYKACGISDERIEILLEEEELPDLNGESWLYLIEVSKLLNIPPMSLLYLLDRITDLAYGDILGNWEFTIDGAAANMFPLVKSMFENSTLKEICGVTFTPENQADSNRDNWTTSNLTVEFNVDDQTSDLLAGLSAMIRDIDDLNITRWC